MTPTRLERLRPPQRRLLAAAPWLPLVGAAAAGQVAALLWLAASSRTMGPDTFGTVLGAQALYLSVQIVLDAGSWLYGARDAARGPLSDEQRGRLTRVRLELALVGAVICIAFALVAGGRMLDAVAPYVVALLLFAVLNTWEPFGRGRRAPYLGYITLRSLTPAVAASGFALGGAAQPVAIPGLAECVAIATVATMFRLSPVRALRCALAAGSGPRVGILRVSLPQIAAQSVMAAGTLALSLVGAAASAGLLGAGVKILGGLTTLVGSAALASFRHLAGDAPADGARHGARSGLRGLVATVSWLSLALSSGLGLAAPLIALILLGGTSDAGVTTIIAVVAAIPPAGIVAALTSPLIAQRREGAVGATYLTGVAVVVLGAGIVLVVAGPSAPGMAAALTAAQLAMAVQLIAHARSVLDGENLGKLAVRAFVGAAVTLLAAFAPVLRSSVLSALLIVALAGLGTSHRRLLRSSASALRLRAGRRRPVRGRARPWVLAAVLAPVAVAAGIAAAVLGAARRADVEALLGFDPYVALLVASLSVLALGGYIVWPSRWNVPAHIAVGFCISAYVVPILLTDTLDHYPTSTVRDYAKLVGLGAAAHVVGLVVARRRWGGRPPALLGRLLAPRLPADRTLAERTTNVILVAGAGLTLGFALAGFVPLLAADPLSAKLLRGEYQEAYIGVAPLYRFSLYVLAALVPVGLAGWWVTRRPRHLLGTLLAFALLLGALNREPALTGLVTFVGILAARRRSTSLLYVAGMAIGFPLVGASFFFLLGSLFGLSNFSEVYGLPGAGALDLWQRVAAGAPDVSDQLTFMLAYGSHGPLTFGRTFVGGLVPYHFAWNPAIWSMHIMLPDVDVTYVLGGVRLPAPVWGFTAFGWPGVVAVPLISGLLLGAFASVAREEVGRGSLLRSALLLAIYASVAVPISEFYFLGNSLLPPLAALIWISRRWSILPEFKTRRLRPEWT